ncbi:MAG: hypothetical protein AAF821_09995 [Cyanobacteria bacterium P01_D01_bin.156]
MGSVVMLTLFPTVALSQNNQSDVTGPNLSDVTGPNLSDVTGPNQSDNTGILREEIFQTSTGDFVTLGEFFQDFFETYGEEFALDSSGSLEESLREVGRACSNDQPNSTACIEFSDLVQVARLSLENYRRTANESLPANRRVW